MNFPRFLMIGFLILIFLQSGMALADNGPHGSYTGTTDACAGCHRAHTAQNPYILIAPAQDNALCFTCHNGTGASPIPVVSTHANIDFSEKVEANFTMNCVSCHDAHGNPNNLFSIKDYVVVKNGPSPVTTGNVNFTSITGINSFDDGISSPASRICVTCHDHPDNPGFPMTNHVGGANHLEGNDYTGQDCSTCHSHSADSDPYTQDGFMPVLESNPIAAFTVTPPNGTVATVFLFNASSSTDAQDPTSAMQVRWDWQNDGIYDTVWSYDKTETYSFSTVGSHTVRLEVRDTKGLTDNTTRIISVIQGEVGTHIYLPLVFD
jgi:predicted CXXCH cytochrome family protein